MIRFNLFKAENLFRPPAPPFGVSALGIVSPVLGVGTRGVAAVGVAAVTLGPAVAVAPLVGILVHGLTC
jgi:hypothetical protein